MTQERSLLAAELRENQAMAVNLQARLKEVEDSPCSRCCPESGTTVDLALSRVTDVQKTAEAEIHVTLINSEEEQNLRFSVADMSAMFAENEKLRAAGDALIQTIEQQKKAHQQLRTTVNDLMEDIKARPTKMEFLDIRSQYTKARDANNTLSRKLNKLTSEYNAVSAAHAISNAELSKLRTNSEESGKRARDRTEHANVSRINSILGNVENILHHHHYRPKNTNVLP
jgi:uncharacterized protein YeeX (DUF496 family)